MVRLIVRFIADERGVAAVEYGLLGGLITIVIISAITSVGTKLSADFSKVAGNL